MRKPRIQPKIKIVCAYCGKEFYGRQKQICCGAKCRVRRYEEFDKIHLKRLVSYSRRRAREKGVESTLTINSLTAPTHCPILGIELIYRNKGQLAYNSASIDRIDLNKGYIDGNCQVVSFRANTMKSNAPPEQLISFAKWVLRNYKEPND